MNYFSLPLPGQLIFLFSLNADKYTRKEQWRTVEHPSRAVNGSSSLQCYYFLWRLNHLSTHPKINIDQNVAFGWNDSADTWMIASIDPPAGSPSDPSNNELPTIVRRVCLCLQLKPKSVAFRWRFLHVVEDICIKTLQPRDLTQLQYAEENWNDSMDGLFIILKKKSIYHDRQTHY